MSQDFFLGVVCGAAIVYFYFKRPQQQSGGLFSLPIPSLGEYLVISNETFIGRYPNDPPDGGDDDEFVPEDSPKEFTENFRNN